jgi:hypothetical protein
MQRHADWAVTMGCGDACPYVTAIIEDWDIPDPAGKELAEVRAIRDEIGGRVDDMVMEHAEEIRTDDRGHRDRLAMVLPRMLAEFGDDHDPREVRDCADVVLASFDDVPIRSYAVTLAERRIRECLRADTCFELEGRR